MLSKEMQKWISACRETKNATKELVFTPEFILEARANQNQMAKQYPVPEEIEIKKECINGIQGEFYRFRGERDDKLNNKIVLFIHGGGFATGSVESRRLMCVNTLKHAKLDGFSMEYTQFPEGQFPEGLVDAIRGFKGLQKRGYAPEDIYLMGESGGAMLCLGLTLYLKDHGQALPGKVCVFSPATNIETENDSRISREERDPAIQGFLNRQLDFYFSDEDRKSKYASVIYGDYSGFPKFLSMWEQKKYCGMMLYS